MHSLIPTLGNLVQTNQLLACIWEVNKNPLRHGQNMWNSTQRSSKAQDWIKDHGAIKLQFFALCYCACQTPCLHTHKGSPTSLSQTTSATIMIVRSVKFVLGFDRNKSPRNLLRHWKPLVCDSVYVPLFLWLSEHRSERFVPLPLHGREINFLKKRILSDPLMPLQYSLKWYKIMLWSFFITALW